MCSRAAGVQGSVFVVDDDASLIEYLADNLTLDRLQVTTATSGEEAVRLLVGLAPDIAIVDVTLPGMSGIELVETVRRGGPENVWDSSMPIIVLSGRGDEHTPVRALMGGADDFVAKPFSYPELHARIAALLRRARGKPSTVIRVGPLEVDRSSHRASVNQCLLDLSTKEFGLLAALAQSPDRVITKQELLRDVWGYIGRVRTRTVDSHASRLRCKLAEAGAPGLVANVWGVGYRLLGDV